MVATGITSVSLTYLNNLETSLQDVLTLVNKQIQGEGATSDPTTTLWIDPVDYSLTVNAGGVGQGRNVTFDAGAALNQALSTMGGSVHDQLIWLRKVLTEMITEVSVTIKNFGTSQDANNEAVGQLVTEFQSTIDTVAKPRG
jgi:hypothetical protein